MRFKILHEFGHALGFEHEHQRPDLNCEAEFDPDALARWAAGVGWREADIRVNLRKLNPQGREVSARHDKQSIMHYSLAPEILRDGTSNRCWVAENLDLSEGDKEFARAQYPLPVAAATANNASAEHRTSRPAAPPDPKQAEVQRQATLKAELAQVLKKGRVPDSDAAKVVDAFAAEVARLRSAPSR